MFRIIFVVVFGLTFCFAFECAAQPPIASEAKLTKPLQSGVQVPDVSVLGMDGKEISLKSLYAKQPLIVVFFRGSWCPICSQHTQQIVSIYPKLQEQGAELIGISPDNPTNTTQNYTRRSLPFKLYSDTDVKAARAFGLAYRVDEETVAKYRSFGIDLEKASGSRLRSLPIPAVYIIDTSGTILFAHSDPDYRKRLDAGKIVEQFIRSK